VDFDVRARLLSTFRFLVNQGNLGKNYIRYLAISYNPMFQQETKCCLVNLEKNLGGKKCISYLDISRNPMTYEPNITI
jgi:hypothetical protein